MVERRLKSFRKCNAMLAALLIFGPPAVLAESRAAPESGEAVCGNPFRNHFGPFDYRTAKPEDKNIVERVHFTPKVESLKGGNTTMTAGGDMAYTLNVFPNHHRALMALIKLARKEKTNRPRDMGYSVECRFDRAERFAPDDSMVKALHGAYLLQKGSSEEGAKKLEEALALAGDNANIHYNLGLAYFELKDYDKSLASAHRAYQLGFQFPGLRNKLEKVGKWSDPPPLTRSGESSVNEDESVSGGSSKE